jgi:6-pyruvoyltetrahydropterin/6-carboxytetrahydropterin synthase
MTHEMQTLAHAFGQSFRVTKEVEFDAGHRVPLHDSKCKNPHGHRYKVKAHVVGPLKTAGSETGMVVDFSRIKHLLTHRVHDKYDHGFIVQDSDEALRRFLLCDFTYPADDDQTLQHEAWKVLVVDYAPTAENVAAAIYGDLYERVGVLGAGVFLQSIEVYETPTSVAVFPA